ncbi:hypothetical protein T440DRAFT_181470 [Plenodomus tracheiphilus IPT5]|uniref:Uncharacterized protein n=1 Tax=Plenodomus tracheiphilus IPT5 TaxID=1408161 RepID=A0A6A7AXN8_9PLEO|nr:hypothetical protein T440DRAFT_181470 [Plenodomus tracheiphilus IPT5]
MFRPWCMLATVFAAFEIFDSMQVVRLVRVVVALRWKSLKIIYTGCSMPFLIRKKPILWNRMLPSIRHHSTQTLHRPRTGAPAMDLFTRTHSNSPHGVRKLLSHGVREDQRAACNCKVLE